jgi:DNA-binding CsgD family transcriptional regulator
MEKLLACITESIEKNGHFQINPVEVSDKITITAAQAEILRMIADGLSNSAIAKKRDISLRAAEGLIQRTFQALGVNGDSDMNPRVIAVRMWQQGKVAVK